MEAKDKLIKEVRARLMALRDATQVAYEKGDYAPEIGTLAREIAELCYKAGVEKVVKWVEENLVPVAHNKIETTRRNFECSPHCELCRWQAFKQKLRHEVPASSNR